MTPEQRARQLIDSIRSRQEAWDWHADAIASAIRDAEHDALERAEMRSLQHHDVGKSADFNEAVLKCSRSIRSLRLQPEGDAA